MTHLIIIAPGVLLAGLGVFGFGWVRPLDWSTKILAAVALVEGITVIVIGVVA